MTLSVYVAGPMAGMHEHNFPAFAAETARLRALGYQVLSPHEKVPPADLQAAIAGGLDWRNTPAYREYLKADLRMVLEVDALSCLPGWWGSNGARLEVFVAHKVGTPTWCAQHGPDLERHSLACNDCRHLLLPDLG